MLKLYTQNANMANHSVGARDELHESEACKCFMFCFVNASPEKSCFVVDLVRFVSTRLYVPECHQKGVKSSTVKEGFSSFVSSLLKN